MTRLEKLRNMSAEELAENLCADCFDAFCNPAYCPRYTADGCELVDKLEVASAEIDAACKAACVNYLNGEVEEAEGK